MDERIKKLKSPDKCEIFARNAERQGREDFAQAARRRAVELHAESYGAKSQAEKECLQAVYAYERTLLARHGKAVKASYTWRMIKAKGIIAAVESAVSKPQETAGYHSLVAMGLQDFAFEAVVLRYPELFSSEAVERSRERLLHGDNMK